MVRELPDFWGSGKPATSLMINMTGGGADAGQGALESILKDVSFFWLFCSL